MTYFIRRRWLGTKTNFVSNIRRNPRVMKLVFFPCKESVFLLNADLSHKAMFLMGKPSTTQEKTFQDLVDSIMMDAFPSRCGSDLAAGGSRKKYAAKP